MSLVTFVVIAFLEKKKSNIELYSGEKSGSLTERNNLPYKRRADLIDPTPILDKAK